MRARVCVRMTVSEKGSRMGVRWAGVGCGEPDIEAGCAH